MRTYEKQFGAAGSWVTAIAAKYFRLMACTVGQTVDVNLYRNGAIVYEAVGVETGFYSVPPDGFDRVEIITAVAQTVKIAVSDGYGGYDKTMDAVAIVGTVPVLTEQTANIGHATYAVGTAAAAACVAPASRPARREMIFHAPLTNTDAVYLGNSVVTTANGAIRLAPGDTYIAHHGMAAQWYAISGTAAQSVRTTEIY